MRWAIVLSVFGCNQVFGLHKTGQPPPADAVFYDAPIDAPFACPPIGTAPEFSTVLHQDGPQDCSSITFSQARGREAGYCASNGGSNNGLFDIHVGPIDRTLAEIPGQSPGVLDLQFPRLTPEGDALFVIPYNLVGAFYGNWELHHVNDDGTWSAAIDTHVATGTPDSFSTPTALAIGRRVLHYDNAGQLLHELLDDGSGTNWNEVAAFAPPSPVPTAMKLSSDGLRLVLRGPLGGIYYADRAALGLPFNPAVPLVGAPAGVFDVYMTDDCARIYFGGIGMLFWEQRI